MTKKNLAAILVMLLLLTSCGTGTPAPEETEPETETVETPAETEEEIDFSKLSFIERIQYSNKSISDNLPERDYEGRTLKLQLFEVKPEELTGDSLNDAWYNQYMTVEERFNVTIDAFRAPWSDIYEWTTGLQGLALSGDHFADIVQCWNNRTSLLTTGGSYTDLAKLEYIDMTKPWYLGDEMDMYSYNGQYYAATNFMDTNTLFNEMSAILVNKDLAVEHNLENLYDVVREGRWTLEYVIQLSSEIYVDTNGDSKRNIDDRYALNFAPAGSWLSTPATMGIPQVDKNENGDPIITVFENAEKAQVILDNMRQLVREQGSRSSSDWGLEIFFAGNAVLAAGSIGNLHTLRDVDFDYGILPPWKADELQEQYYTSYLPDPWMIPISAPDMEFCAIMMTALSAEGYKQMLPVCYESVLKNKLSQDEDTGEMLDLMMNNVRADGSLIFGPSSYIYATWNYTIGSQGFGSYWASKRSELETAMEDVLTAFAEMQNRQ